MNKTVTSRLQPPRCKSQRIDRWQRNEWKGKKREKHCGATALGSTELHCTKSGGRGGWYKWWIIVSLQLIGVSALVCRGGREVGQSSSSVCSRLQQFSCFACLMDSRTGACERRGGRRRRQQERERERERGRAESGSTEDELKKEGERGRRRCERSRDVQHTKGKERKEGETDEWEWVRVIQ